MYKRINHLLKNNNNNNQIILNWTTYKSKVNSREHYERMCMKRVQSCNQLKRTQIIFDRFIFDPHGKLMLWWECWLFASFVVSLSLSRFLFVYFCVFFFFLFLSLSFSCSPLLWTFNPLNLMIFSLQAHGSVSSTRSFIRYTKMFLNRNVCLYYF